VIETRSLRQFLVLAQQLHYGRAAAALHMTQPPLSMAIQKLEQSLGVALFERNRRSVALSPAGAALLPVAAKLLEEIEQLPALLQSAAAGLHGRLRLGFVSTVGYGELPQWLRSFRAAHPGIALALREATLDVQLHHFERGDLDAGFVIHPPGAAPAGFEALRISVEPMVLALPESLALPRAPAAALALLLSEPLVIFPREIAPSLYDALLSFYRGHGATPQIAQEAIQMQTIVNLVSAGMGVAWVPEGLSALQRPGVRYQQLQAQVPACETSLIWRAGASPVVARFVEHVRAALAQVPKARAGKRAGAVHNAPTSRPSTKRSTQR